MGLFDKKPPNVFELEKEKNTRKLRDALKWDKDSENIRAYAARALGRLRDPKAVEPLIATLEAKDRMGYPDKDARLMAAVALGRIGDARAVEPLRTAGLYGNEDLSAAVTWAMGAIGDPAAREYLCARVGDAWRGSFGSSVVNHVDDIEFPQDTRIGAAIALRRMPGAGVEEALIKALKNPYCDVRSEAARTLGFLRSTAAIPELLTLLDEVIPLMDPDACLAAAGALARLGEKSAVPSLRTLFSGKETGRAVAVIALQRLTGEAIPGGAEIIESRVAQLLERRASGDAFHWQPAQFQLLHIAYATDDPALLERIINGNQGWNDLRDKMRREYWDIFTR